MPCRPRAAAICKRCGAGVAGEVHLDEASAHEHDADGDLRAANVPVGDSRTPARRARHCIHRRGCADVRQFGGKHGFIEANAATHPSKRAQAQAHPAASLAANPETRTLAEIARAVV